MVVVEVLPAGNHRRARLALQGLIRLPAPLLFLIDFAMRVYSFCSFGCDEVGIIVMDSSRRCMSVIPVPLEIDHLILAQPPPVSHLLSVPVDKAGD